VIGIIAVLIAILLPALAKARRSAAQQQCASNLRQIAIAINTYATENGGALVPYGVQPISGTQTLNGVSGNEQIGWSYMQFTPSGGGTPTYIFADGYLGKYLMNVNVLTCPATQGLFSPTATGPPTGYALSQLLQNASATATQRVLWRIGEIAQSSTTVAAADSIQYSTHTGFTYPTTLTPPDFGTPYGNFHGRHQGGNGNVAFFDGHVEAIQATMPTFLSAAAATYAPLLNQNHLGVLIPTPVNFAADGVVDHNSYISECGVKYDYYFVTTRK
jgi:prepilin-type processing-associated H-X9-DG protein